MPGVTEAEVRFRTVRTRPLIADGLREVLFTVSEARRALPYVARVAQDAVSAFQQVQECRMALHQARSPQERTVIAQRRDRALIQFNRAIDEFDDVGADIVNLAAGIVRFNATVDGRRVSLVWRLNESTAVAWRELDR